MSVAGEREPEHGGQEPRQQETYNESEDKAPFRTIVVEVDSGILCSS